MANIISFMANKLYFFGKNFFSVFFFFDLLLDVFFFHFLQHLAITWQPINQPIDQTKQTDRSNEPQKKIIQKHTQTMIFLAKNISD